VECGHCSAGTAAAQYQLDVPLGTFFPASSAACETCESDYCGSFLLDYDPLAVPLFEDTCVWTSAVFEACFYHVRDDEGNPVGPPELREFFWQLEIGGARPNLLLIEKNSPLQTLRHHWAGTIDPLWNGDCGFDAEPLAYESTIDGIIGCLIDDTKLLLLTSL
jgi:hypothetical protein